MLIMGQISILFLSTGNSCRSQMAEGWAKKILSGSTIAQRHNIEISSAGTQIQPVNAKAIQVMAEEDIDIAGQRSDVLVPDQLEEANWIVTLCDQVREHCFVITNKSHQRHWSVADIAVVKENPENTLQCFREVRDQIRGAVVNFVAELESWYELAQVQFSDPDMEILKRHTEYRGFFEIQQLTLRHRLYEGGWTEPFNRELFLRGLAVVVMLYDPAQDKLVLIEQFRVGAIGDKRSPWLLEMVAGIVEPGETPEQVAHREAMEEAGCRIGELIKLHECWTSPGGTNERIIIYCGKVDATDIGGVHGLKEEHEDICVKVVSCDWAFSAMEQGIIDNAATIMALQWLQLNRNRLKSQWQ